jgi:formamidopyrimidine-DNA glycosylase
VPELPEVETVVRSLQCVAGRTILNAEFRKMRILHGDPDESAAFLRTRTINAVERYGKFIVLRLAPSGFLIVHLGMTGKLLLDAPIAKHTHAILTLDQGVLQYEDSRQFGRIECCEKLPQRIRKLGPDALDVDLDSFSAMLRRRKTRMKSLLLNQGFLRGLGNIYADEALFRAGIHPLATGSRLTRRRVRKLYDAIREVLSEAIESKGSSISDYVDSAGNRGSFQDRHRVYQRTGEPCVNCGAPIRRTLVAQRGTHFCPMCQRR